MIKTIVKILISIYLASAILNTIQIYKIFMKLEKIHFRIDKFLLFFLYVFIHPRSVIIGTVRALKDWYWLEGKIRKNKSGYFEVVNKNNESE